MDRRESTARSGDSTDGATEMGFNLVLLKRGDLRGYPRLFPPPSHFRLLYGGLSSST